MADSCRCQTTADLNDGGYVVGTSEVACGGCPANGGCAVVGPLRFFFSIDFIFISIYLTFVFVLFF